MSDSTHLAVKHEKSVGAPIAGHLSDKYIRTWKAKRGFWYPEDRLRASLIGALILVPLSVLGSGLLTQYVGGPIGLTLNLLCLFINGLGVGHTVAIDWFLSFSLTFFNRRKVDLVLGPSAAYIMDILQSRSAEAMASNK